LQLFTGKRQDYAPKKYTKGGKAALTNDGYVTVKATMVMADVMKMENVL